MLTLINSCFAEQGPTIPTSSPQVVERRTEVTKDTVFPTNNRITEDVQPSVVPVENQNPIFEPVDAPVSAPMPNPKPSIPYPSRQNDEKRRENANEQKEKFYEIFKDMIIDECLALADLGASINLMPFSMWKKLNLLNLTPMCMTLELADRSISRLIGIAKDVNVKIGVFQFLADFVVVDFEPDPRVPLILRRCFLKTNRALIDVCTSGNPTLGYDLIVSNSSPTLTPFRDNDFLLLKEADAFLALADDLTSPEVDAFCYYDLEGDFLLIEAKKELKLCEAKTAKSSIDEPLEVKLKDLPPHLEYAFLEDNNMLPVIIAKDLSIDEKTALIKLNEATRKDHFPLPFMDQMLERLAGNEYYCFLNGFSGYFQILIDPKDQENTTFTSPYGMFAYRRMPFGLCNAPSTFQRCMMAIFHDMIEKTMEVFMDDFSVFRNSFLTCLSNLEKLLKRCEDTNLALNWEKSHFMVKEGIVLGHIISKKGIEVNKAKIDVIAKLPHSTTVKGIRSFLGHAGRGKKLHDSKIKNRYFACLVIQGLDVQLSSKIFSESLKPDGRPFSPITEFFSIWHMLKLSHTDRSKLQSELLSKRLEALRFGGDTPNHGCPRSQTFLRTTMNSGYESSYVTRLPKQSFVVSDIDKRTKNEAKLDKTEHGNEKSYKVKRQGQKVNRKVNPDKVKVNQVKKIQLVGPKMQNPKVVY
ncbi:reverse transcriptase domain-containing protein [Tanacetum coccineum]